MKIRLKRPSLGEVVDLSEMESTGWGFQALPGASGFGRLDRTLGWTETLTHGAILTGSRYARRELTIPFAIDTRGLSDPRKELFDRHDKLMRMLSGEFILEASSDDASMNYSLTCHAPTGGSVVFGEDTNGRDWFRAALTIEAGYPFWQAITPMVETTTVGPGVFLNKNLNLKGNAPTPLQITISKSNAPLTGINTIEYNGKEILSLDFARAVNPLTSFTLDSRNFQMKGVEYGTGTQRVDSPEIIAIPHRRLSPWITIDAASLLNQQLPLTIKAYDTQNGGGTYTFTHYDTRLGLLY